MRCLLGGVRGGKEHLEASAVSHLPLRTPRAGLVEEGVDVPVDMWGVGCAPAHVALGLWKQQSSPGRGSGASVAENMPRCSLFVLLTVLTKSILLFQF